ncbi:MAG: type VI secretion system-associated FHA domain protein TagH [Methylococcales bacterium]|nr:type VI secretion system-associated FHA domain protein TagH [Methylococcales bacterium]
MSLTLTVLSFKNQPLPDSKAVSIGVGGGSIGRSDDNTLVLPDPEKFVSRHHASISMDNGCYYLSDTSLGGIQLNGQPTPLNNATIRIDDGTKLKVGEYEIAVAITKDPIIEGFPFDWGDAAPEPSTFLQVEETWLEREELGANPLMSDDFARHDDLVQANGGQQTPVFESVLQGNQSPLSDSYIAPEIVKPAAVEEIPDNLSFDDFFSTSVVAPPSGNELSGGQEHGAVAPPAHLDAKVVPPMTGPSFLDGGRPSVIPQAEAVNGANQFNPESGQGGAGVLWQAFLQGAGVPDVEIQPGEQAETLRRIGKMFRKLVDGTVAVLRSRAEFKSLCRVNMTVIKAANNNPLKFTVSTEDVLQQLIENKSGGFLASTAAIEEAFEDIMDHQLAMQAGIQASLTGLLKTLDPGIIERQFEQGIVLQKKSKCWDKYEASYHNTIDEAVENFYGEAFVKAYEKQMGQLKNSRRK